MSKVNLTTGRIDQFKCPEGTSQAFLRDAKTPALSVRATPSGHKSYVFEAKLRGRTIRIALGSVKTWTIDEARTEAAEWAVAVDKGTDPRAVIKARSEAKETDALAERLGSVTVASLWPTYLREGKPAKRDAWKPRYLADLKRAGSLGGVLKKRGEGVTAPGTLAPLLPYRLSDVDQDVIREWIRTTKIRAPAQAARAAAMFSGFLNWCATKKELRDLVDRNAARASGLGDILPGTRRRTDAIEIDQLEGWFHGCAMLNNQTASAYLQALILTGARREEMAALRWQDIDFRWKKLTIADKIEDTRQIPLTPYLGSLLENLPRQSGTFLTDGKVDPRCEFVFASKSSRSGRLTEPRSSHATVLKGAEIPHVSIHGLRRSFSLLGEAAGAPAGAIAQVMGHKPSALAERYRPRSIDALRPYLASIEQFILAKAGIKWPPATVAANASSERFGRDQSSTDVKRTSRSKAVGTSKTVVAVPVVESTSKAT